MFKLLRLAALLLLASFLFGCGGGGGDTPTGDVRVSLSYYPPSGTVGTAYRYSPNYYSSQSISEHFALSSGSLPPGLGISAGDGVISGTPTTPGTYYFTVTLTAKDVDGSISASGSITITSDLSVSLTYSPPSGVVGQAYSYTPVLTSNKAITPTFSASGLPAGLSINASTGAITGTPTTAGSYYYVTITMTASGITPIYRYPTITINATASNSSSSSGGASSSTSSVVSSSSSSAASAAPVLSASTSSVQFGGSTGRSFSDSSLNLSLNQSGSYAWSVSAKPAWLGVSKTGGTLGSSADSLTLSADVSKLSAGVNSGTLSLQAVVGSQTITRDVTVTALLDKRKLIASEIGVAFVKTPGWSRLTRTLTVRDNFGTGNWTASANQSWLTVTSSGASGSSLVLTADPTGLAADQLHMATVTVNSASGAAAETITVGLWNGSSTPSGKTTIASAYTTLAVDPVRPYAYVHNGGSVITIYNIYTAASIGTISLSGTTLGTMEMSPDGKRLYALNGMDRVLEIDPLNKTLLNTWTASVSGGGSAQALRYVRPNGEGMVIMAGPGYWDNGRIFRARDGAQLSPTANFVSGVMAVSPDQGMLVTTEVGLSPGTLHTYGIDYSEAVGKLGVVAKLSKTIGSNCKSLAVSRDGATIYTACGAPYAFGRYALSTLVTGTELAGNTYPNNVTVASDGRLFAGLSNWYDTTDFWVYRADGTVSSSYLLRGYAREILDHQLQPSGDAFMAVALTAVPNLQFVPVGPDTVAAAVSAARFVQVK